MDTKEDRVDKKYVVYRNDIKYKKHRNIDINKAIWNDDVKIDFLEKNTDMIEYRLEECKREKYNLLDLSNMPCDEVMKIFTNDEFRRIEKKIQHMFINNSELTELPDLTTMTSLLTLDISSNNILILPQLPGTIEELIANNNKLTTISQVYPNLKRFDIAKNNVDNIIYSPNIESLKIYENPIKTIIQLNKVKFMDISDTNILKIFPFPELNWLECVNTKIQHIPRMPKLETLLCQRSMISMIDIQPSIKTIEIVGSKVCTLDYMKTLETLVVSHDDNEQKMVKLSNKYKMKVYRKNKNNVGEIKFYH